MKVYPKNIAVAIVAAAVVAAVVGVGIDLSVSNHNSQQQVAELQRQSSADRSAAASASASSMAAAAKAKDDKQAADLAKAKKDAADAKAMASSAANKPARVPVVIYREYTPATPSVPYNPSYLGGYYGVFSLTSDAYPGPIHSYASPSDTSAFVETIPANSLVSVSCSVHGQPLQGRDLWDWDGSGWIWDWMVEMGGGNPPSC